MRQRSGLTVALVLLVWAVVWSATGGAQTLPDFTGRWLLESEHPTSVPTELVVRQTSAPGSPLLSQVTVTRHGPSGASSETLQVGTIGGTVSGSRSGPRTFRRVAWEDSRLVIEVETLRGQTSSAPLEQRREVWSVTPAGTLQVEITESGSSRATQTMTLVYRRSSAADAHRPYAV